MITVFPRKITNSTYYRIHVRYIINLLSGAGCTILFTDEDTSVDGSKFVVMMDGSPVLFDFCDFSCETTNWSGPYFKLHYDETKTYAKNIHPFPPVSFYNWQEFEELSKNVVYNSSGAISYRQRAYGGATERRTKLKSLLQSICKNTLETDILPQREYWRSISRDLVQVFAPGAREGILDRAQLQCMALGECTISPKITDMVADRCLIPDVHYIRCKDDFSDLPVILSIAARDSEMNRAIGSNVKALFKHTCRPNVIMKYMRRVLDD